MTFLRAKSAAEIYNLFLIPTSALKMYYVKRDFMPYSLASCLMLIVFCLSIQTTSAAEVIVNITGASSDTGSIGCGLFSSKEGFPMDLTNATLQTHVPDNGAAVCVFKNLTAGNYAVGSVHDVNNNGKTDTNFLGIPKEAWGVSNNVRPRLRAPTFGEAQFSISEGDSVKIDIYLDR